MKTNWRSTGAEQGLWVNVISDRGHQIRVATHEDAFNLVTILNQLEEAAAFGWQCIQAIAATPPASPWQPISTAPRDGRPVLLWYTQGQRWVIMEWHKDPNGLRHRDKWWTGFDDDGFSLTDADVSGWAELPLAASPPPPLPETPTNGG